MLHKPRAKWLVLVVEDDEDLQALLIRILEREGYEVMCAGDGHSGLAMASARPRPSLIISDIMMPDMDGLEMVSQIKRDAATKHTPVIFLTAKDTPSDVIAGIKAGARLYLTKPFRPEQLLERIRQVLPPVPD